MTRMSEDTTQRELESVLAAAAAARAPLRDTSATDRAHALRHLADVLDAAVRELVPLANEETGLPVEPRLVDELDRATFQLRLLAEAVVGGAHLEATLDPPDPDWAPGGRPDLRRLLVPIGPVVVFAAGAAPFALGVAGGDTAAALAVGCPVVVRSHPDQPELSARITALVAGALADRGLPAGAFAVVSGEPAGRAAVLDRRIRAGAFSGSAAEGRALFDLACSRPDPIPFHAELGGVNPVFVTDAAARSRAAEIAEGYLASSTLAMGQLPTNPGLLFVPDTAAPSLERRLVAGIAEHPAGRLLSDRAADDHARTLSALTAHPVVRVLARGVDSTAGPAPTLLATTAVEFLAHRDELVVPCPGPTSVLVAYTGEDELLACARSFPGELTATVHGEGDEAVAAALTAELSDRAGRVLWNDWPTGVAVTYAMHHGGPYPATTAPQHTSVGTASLRRFLRPVAFQNVPQHLLPAALRDGNPLGIPRRVDGTLTPPR